MTKASTKREARKIPTKREVREVSQGAAQDQGVQQQEVKEQQQFFDGLFEMLKSGKLPDDKHILVEMLAVSQEKLKVGHQQLSQIGGQLQELQARQQQLVEAFTHEKGTTTGLTEALWKMRDQIQIPKVPNE